MEPVPEFAPVTVEVQAEALGLSAQEVEDLVTVPLESNLLSGVAWVDRMQSSSIAGLSSVVMTFEEGTDPLRARQVVQERLTQGALLTNASKAPVMLQPTSAANRVMMVGLSSQDQDLVDLSVLSRWTIRPKLMSVQGVANVAVWGMRDRQLHVQADPARMQQHGVSLDEVVATTGNSLWVSPLSFLEASTPGRGGFLDLPQQRVNVQHVSPITDDAALGRVAVEGAARGSRSRTSPPSSRRPRRSSATASSTTGRAWCWSSRSSRASARPRSAAASRRRWRRCRPACRGSRWTPRCTARRTTSTTPPATWRWRPSARCCCLPSCAPCCTGPGAPWSWS